MKILLDCKILFTIYLVSLFLGSCKNQKVSLDPHYPNIGIKVKHLKKQGWELTSFECGVCVHQHKSIKPKIIFYGDTKHRCKFISAQEINFDLKYSNENMIPKVDDNFQLTNKDLLSQKIDSVLNTLNSKRITEFKIVTESRLTFSSQNIYDKKVLWNIFVNEKNISLSSHFDFESNLQF